VRGCLIDVASGLEFLDSAPSFADTEVQDTEAVDSTECVGYAVL
jgi:hypothetical protein